MDFGNEAPQEAPKKEQNECEHKHTRIQRVSHSDNEDIYGDVVSITCHEIHTCRDCGEELIKMYSIKPEHFDFWEDDMLGRIYDDECQHN